MSLSLETLKVAGGGGGFGWRAVHTPDLTSKVDAGSDRPLAAVTEDLREKGEGGHESAILTRELGCQ